MPGHEFRIEGERIRNHARDPPDDREDPPAAAPEKPFLDVHVERPLERVDGKRPFAPGALHPLEHPGFHATSLSFLDPRIDQSLHAAAMW